MAGAPAARQPAPPPAFLSAAPAPGADRFGIMGRSQPPRSPGVCLDYLKGKCSRKRLQCRFLHPDLSALQRQFGPDGGPAVCEVWALTGSCKFGARCLKAHFCASPSGAPPLRLCHGVGPTPPEQGFACNDRDAGSEFEAFAESLLSPFNRPGFGSFGSVSSEALSDDSSNSSLEAPTSPNSASSAVKSGLALPAAGLDPIFMDILKDLHIIAS